jgi:hypothetical protein
VLLSVLTVVVELDVARARAAHDASASLWRTLRSTVRNTIIHPVVLPVLAGGLFNATGLPLPAPLDETLQLLGTAVAPLCLVLIGITLAYTAGRAVLGAVRGALGLAAVKLLLQPALVLVVAHWGLGLNGLPLQVAVVMAGLPAGTVSGAPKVRAMQIIDELEPEKRGVYGGGVGYFAANGEMDMCIALRTAVLQDEVLYIQAGGGVVYDSDPEAEYEETVNKSRALRRAAEDAGLFARRGNG